MIPGAPVIIIGHNDRIAWGLTNAMIDDADFYYELVDSSHSNMYRFEKNSLPFLTHEEKIYIKPSDSLIITVRETHHGPIINDVHPALRHTDSLQRASTPVSMRWTGLDVSDEIYGFYLMDKASSYETFEKGVREITVPAQSIVYADVDNTIAYWTAGKIPIRGKGNPMLPLAAGPANRNGKVFSRSTSFRMRKIRRKDIWHA